VDTGLLVKNFHNLAHTYLSFVALIFLPLLCFVSKALRNFASLPIYFLFSVSCLPEVTIISSTYCTQWQQRCSHHPLSLLPKFSRGNFSAYDNEREMAFAQVQGKDIILFLHRPSQ